MNSYLPLEVFKLLEELRKSNQQIEKELFTFMKERFGNEKLEYLLYTINFFDNSLKKNHLITEYEGKMIISSYFKKNYRLSNNDFEILYYLKSKKELSE